MCIKNEIPNFSSLIKEAKKEKYSNALQFRNNEISGFVEGYNEVNNEDALKYFLNE